MAQAEFLRIVKPDKINYAEIYWSKGELGAPYCVWWDLPMCLLQLKLLKGTDNEAALLAAVTALQALK